MPRSRPRTWRRRIAGPCRYDVVGVLDRVGLAALADELGQALLAFDQRQAVQVLAVLFQHIEEEVGEVRTAGQRVLERRKSVRPSLKATISPSSSTDPFVSLLSGLTSGANRTVQSLALRV